jgi:putative nucleotidyltransferase with HDIG domain
MAERIEASDRPAAHSGWTVAVVWSVVLLACAAFALIWRLPLVPTSAGVAAALICLGLLAEVFAFYEKGRSASGSVAFIPFAAGLFALPDVRTVSLIVVAQIVVQFWHRRSPLKALFNVSQFSLAACVALAVWVSIAPGSNALGDRGFIDAMQSVGLASLLSYLALTGVNAACVSAVMWAASGQKIRDLFSSYLRRTAGLAVLQVVFAFYLAWLSANLGFAGALGMILPILAVRQLMRTAAELSNVTEELLDLMVAAIEARDPYTSGHSKRVAQAAVIIAKSLELKAEVIERVQVAALLHDVGKIDERFARVLAKEGRLTPEEWDTMKQHPIRSAELVEKISSLKDVVPAVRHHHENWDGTGYPDCIKGESIPLASRIIMFADTLDAITTDRPYRKALDPEEARREFIKFRGKQFDPHICDVVVSDPVWSKLYEAVLRSHEATKPQPVAPEALQRTAVA